MDAEHFRHLSRVQGLKIGRKVAKLMREFLSRESSGENGQVYIWKILDLCFGHSDLLGEMTIVFVPGHSDRYARSVGDLYICLLCKSHAVCLLVLYINCIRYEDSNHF